MALLGEEQIGGRVSRRLRGPRRSKSTVEFGSPQDPDDATSTTLAGAAAANHNGTVIDMDGSWVEVELTSTTQAAVTFNHNLFLSTPNYTIVSTAEPNVRWLMMGWIHDGDSASSSDVVVNVWYEGGTVTANSIPLQTKVTVGGTLTVDGDHPMKLTLFFVRADR